MVAARRVGGSYPPRRGARRLCDIVPEKNAPAANPPRAGAGGGIAYWMGTSAGAPGFLISTTRKRAGRVWLALRPTVWISSGPS